MTRISDMTPLVLTSPTGVYVPAEKTGSLTNYRVDIAALSTITPQMFGAAADGVTDDTAAIQAAINYIAPTGGEIYFPTGSYKCASSLNLDGLHNITLVGPSGTGTGFSEPPPAQIIYSGTGARFLDCRSSEAITLLNLGIRYTSSSFAGKLIDFSHDAAVDSAYGLIERCFLGGYSGSASTTAILVNLNQAIICSVVDCNLQFAAVGIKGGQGSYSNSMTVERCTFGNLSIAGVMNAIQMWTVQNCTFETGPRAYYDDQVGGTTNDLSWLNNWHGDGTAVGADTWMSFGTTLVTGLLISGNFFDCSFTNTASIKLSASCQSVTISANSFGGGAAAGIDFGAVNHSGVVVTGNFWVADPVNLSGSADDIAITENKKNGSNAAKHYRRLNGTQEWTIGARNPPAPGPGIFSYNAPTATDCLHWVNGDAGTYRMHIYGAAGVGRMRYGIDSSNQGAEICYDAGGVFVGYSETTTLTTMDKTFGGNVNVASGKVFKVNGSQVVGARGTAITRISRTATAGSLPTADGSITIANAATPTVVELLEYCTELEAKLEELTAKFRIATGHGLIA